MNTKTSPDSKTNRSSSPETIETYVDPRYAKYMNKSADPEDEDKDIDDWGGAGIDGKGTTDGSAPVDTSKPDDWSPTGEG